MSTLSNRTLRRELESELRDDANFPVAPPPADLLAKIQAEIPVDLRAANSVEPIPARRPFSRRTGFGLAASITVALVGMALGYRALERSQESAPRVASVAESSAQMPKGAVLETAPVDLPDGRTEGRDEKLPVKERTKDVGDDAEARAERLDSRGSAVAQSQEQSRELLRKAEIGQVRKMRDAASMMPVSPQPAPQSAGSLELESEADALRSLGYMGGGSTAAAPERQGPIEEPSAAQWTGSGKFVPSSPSTGGTKEPNEQLAGDMFFRPVETNPFVDTAEDRLSTFALDVDTGSWTLARSYLERGQLPPAEAIRVEELVNAQAYRDPEPRRGDFTLVAEGAPSPFAPGESYRLVRFAVKAREIDARDRKPAVLTFVVDVSGSMDRENRLGLVQRSLGLLLDELRHDDRVGLVVYGTRGRVLLGHTNDHDEIRQAIAALRPEGSTNAEEGLRLGYDLADQAWRKEAINRIVLCSDGVANVGATGPESILARIGEQARRGIELTTVGFGMGNYNDALMEQLADQGDGAYHYVDTLDEARRIFVENLTGTLQTVAKDAKVQVEFDPKAVDRWRLIGYENRDVADRDFRNDAVDAGEIGVGHSAVALYEVRLRSGVRAGNPVGTLHLRWKSRATRQVEEAALTLEVGDLDDSFRGASANLRTAAVAAELGERLKRSYWAKEGSWSDLVRAAEQLEAERGRDGAPLADLVRRARGLAGSDLDGSAPERDRNDRERLEED